MHKLKKRVSRIIAFLLVICIVAPSLPVLATTTPEYAIQSRVVASGEEFTVDVLLNNSSDVYGGNFTLQYDSELLEVKSYEFGSDLSNHTKNCNLDYQSAGNLIRFTFSGSTAVIEDGAVVTLTFNVIGAVDNAAALSFVAYKAYGSAGNSLDATAVDADITIANSPVCSLIVHSLEVEAGEEFAVYIQLKNGTHVYSGDIVFQYDDELLTPVGYGYGDCLSAHTKETKQVSTNEGAGISLSFSGNAAFTEETVTLMGIKFKAKEGMSGTVELALPTFRVYAENGTEIQGTSGGGDLTVTLPAATSIDIGEDLTGYAGIDSYELAVAFSPEGAVTESVVWDSSEPTVASVSPIGVVTLLAAGTATITAVTENGLIDSIVVTSKEVQEIVLDTEMNVEFDEDGTITYLKFVPTETATYRFEVNTGGSGGFGIGTSGYQNWGDTIEVTHDLTAGETYYFTCEREYLEAYSILVKKVTNITNMEIVSLPTKMTYYDDMFVCDYSGLKVQFTFGDGTTHVWTYGMDSSVNSEYVSVYNVDDENGYAYTRVECSGMYVDFTFNIVPNPVESIEIYSGEMPALIENTGGYLSEGVYYYDCQPYHMTFKINYTDGSSCIAKVSDNIEGYTVDWKDNQDDPWVVGTNYLIVSYCGKAVDVPVEIVKAERSIDSMTLDTEPTHVYMWGDSEYGSCDGEYYYFEATNLDGISFSVHYSDGSQETYSSDDVIFDGHEYYIGDEWLVIDSFFSATEPGEYVGVISFMGYEVEYQVQLIESTVASIEIVKAPTNTVQEEIYEWDFTGMEILITYTDGTSKLVELTEENVVYEWLWSTLYGFVEVDGYNIVIEPYYGEEMYYIISYMDQAIEYYDMQYSESTVASVEVLNITVDRDKFEDILLKVTYADGTTETLSLDVIGGNFIAEWATGYIKTKGGISYFYVLENVDESGVIQSYEMEFLGCEIEVEYKTEQLVIVNKPDKLEYGIGDKLDLTGIELKIRYSNGVEMPLESGYKISSFDSSTAGLKAITISSAGLSTSYVVSVIDDTIDESAGKIVVSNTTTNRGKQVAVTLSMENNPGIISAKLNVHYDSSVMTLVGVEDKGNLGGVMHSNQYTNPYVLSWANDTVLEDITFNGDIVILIFEVAEDAALGEYIVQVTYDYDNSDICNFELQKVKFNTIDGVVYIVDTLIGDVNGDGAVNTLDRITLARYLANWEGYTSDTIDLVAADVNGDGAVNTLDRITLARHLGNWEGYTELPYTN